MTALLRVRAVCPQVVVAKDDMDHDLDFMRSKTANLRDKEPNRDKESAREAGGCCERVLGWACGMLLQSLGPLFECVMYRRSAG